MVAYSFKQRFVRPIRVGLSRVSLSLDCPPKRQTIRAVGKRRHARPGETLQLYTAMRTKQCMKIGDARCCQVSPIVLYISKDSLGVDIDGDYFCGSTRVREFAQSDGFDDDLDMIGFWQQNHAGIEKFEGMLIRWEPLQ